jgi:hypothetical protein
LFQPEGSGACRRVDVSFWLLLAGIFCGLWDQALGRRLWPGGTDTLAQRFGHAWAERKATLAGSVLVLAAAVVEAA